MNEKEKLKAKLEKIDLSVLSDEQVKAIYTILEKHFSSHEERHHYIYENIQAVYFEANMDSTITDISYSVEIITKRKREELIGTKAHELYYNKADRKKVIHDISNAKDGKLRDYYLEVKDKDGAKLRCSFNAQLIKDKKGAPVKIVGSFIDLTQFYKTIDALTASEEKYHNIFENVQAIYYESTVDGTLLEISPSVEYYTHYKREELIGTNAYDLYYNIEDKGKLIPKISNEGFLRDCYIEVKDKDGAKIQCSLNAKLIKDKNGVPVKYIGAIIDTTQLQKALKDLNTSENRFKDIYENINDIIYTMDFNGNFTSVNPMAEKILGHKFDEITKINMSSYISPETAKVAFDNIAKKLRGEATNTLYEVDFVNKDGSCTSLEINSMISYRDEKPFEIFGIARNITERKKTEDELNKTREKYRILSETTNDLVYTLDLKGNFTSMHLKCEKIIGYKAEEMIGMNVNDFITAESIKASNENLRKKMNGEATNTIYEVDFKKKDGSVITLEVNSMFRYKDGKPYEILGVAREITERKKANEALKKSEDKYKTIFENAPLGIMTADTNGKIIEINSMMLQLLGSQSYEESKQINLLSYPPLVEIGMDCIFKHCIETGESSVTENKYSSKWGKTFNAKAYTKPIINTSGIVTGFQVMVEDITTEVIADEQLKESVKEKEALLRELHHRVKNNMQIIISLINMQMNESNDDLMKANLLDIQQRVWTMAIIHENLYVSKNLSKINFGEYLQKLAGNIASTYSGNNDINLKVNVSNVLLDLDTAIPSGLIVNEILSNSFKHAFPDGWKGKNNEVYVKLETKGNKLLLTIGDNGIGIKDLEKGAERNTLGLVLVEILVKQLKGIIKLYTKKGTRYEIEMDNK